MKKNRIFIYLFFGLFVFWLILSITKTGILVSEGKITYFNQGTIIHTDCTYFYVIKFVYKASDRTTCPFFRDMYGY
jgi:hypothetical protein